MILGLTDNVGVAITAYLGFEALTIWKVKPLLEAVVLFSDNGIDEKLLEDCANAFAAKAKNGQQVSSEDINRLQRMCATVGRKRKWRKVKEWGFDALYNSYRRVHSIALWLSEKPFMLAPSLLFLAMFDSPITGSIVVYSVSVLFVVRLFFSVLHLILEQIVRVFTTAATLKTQASPPYSMD